MESIKIYEESYKRLIKFKNALEETDNLVNLKITYKDLDIESASRFRNVVYDYIISNRSMFEDNFNTNALYNNDEFVIDCTKIPDKDLLIRFINALKDTCMKRSTELLSIIMNNNGR